MRKVWKVLLDASKPSPQVHSLPFGARPVHVDQDTRPAPHIVAVWFEIETEAPKVGYPLWVIGTDHEVPAGSIHCGSIVSGPFGWHVYCGKAKEG